MTDTTIQWTDKTWNPVTGCTKVSAGCKNCYAEKVAERFWKDREFTDVRCHEDRLEQPLHWRKPARIFVNSMSDLFHEDVPFEFIERVFEVMAHAMRHTFQVLTKRPERMMEFAKQQSADCDGILNNGNVWLGVSVEDQRSVQERVWRLRETPASVRFISYEPALGPVDIDLTGIDWVIVGGESGPGARTFDLAWARSMVKQCKSANVACFVKQFGASVIESKWPIQERSFNNFGRVESLKLRDRKGGEPSEWPEDLRIRQYPQAAL